MKKESESSYLGHKLQNFIRVRGARTHNLKNIDIDIPKNQLVVITGLSGSGKSSLAFDTLYAEGQRRYVESLSAYARQFLQMMDKPDVDSIEGLSPAIAIEQKASSHNPRSTVGTVTEIHDYLRLLFARAGTPHCPTHLYALNLQSISQMVDTLLNLPSENRLLIISPIARKIKKTHDEWIKIISVYQAQGFIRFRIDSVVYTMDDLPFSLNNKEDHIKEYIKYNTKDKKSKFNFKSAHDFDIVVDRLKVRPEMQQRLAESLETALRLANGRVIVLENNEANQERKHLFNSRYACAECDYTISDLEPRLFSFNSPAGACATCDGLGSIFSNDGTRTTLCPACKGARLKPESLHVYLVDQSILNAHENNQNNNINDNTNSNSNNPNNNLNNNLNNNINNHYKKNLKEIGEMPLNSALFYFQNLKLIGSKAEIAQKVLIEICARLRFLNDVGLDYLNLARNTESLSGGEAQRIRLASQIGSGLTGVMYVLDEPSIGLHQRDNDRLISTLIKLRDLGNSVLVVEHDEDMMRVADHIIDLGKGAGIHGGKIVAFGDFEAICDLKRFPDSLTGAYLSKNREIPIPNQRIKPDFNKTLKIIGATGHNLKNVTISFPLGLFICVTGVSGSGKSTLINQTLYKATTKHLYQTQVDCAPHNKIEGLELIDKVINVDQSPIGRTPRSNPATYTGLLTPIRELLSEVPKAKERGYSPGRFSFNVSGGRCAACEGDGVLKVEMHFLPDVYVPCDTCKGLRYNRETLEIQYKGKNIAEILAMTVEEAFAFFNAIPSVARRLQTLLDVGLSYIQLGQSATTLSGGEAQRVKLSLELSKRDTGKTLYILDEPSTGLHFADIALLLQVLQKLRNAGNTIIVIEHNLDIIKCADWLIDLGPEGGAKGGEIVAVGSPEQIAAQAQEKSNQATHHTGRYLAHVLK